MRRERFVGIDIGGTNIEIVAVGARGRLCAHRTLSTDARKGPDHALARVGAAVPALVRTNGVLAGVGIGCAGLVDPSRGRLHASPNLPRWRDTPLRRIAKRHLGVYTIVDNDANTTAYGEYLLGCGRGAATMVCITLGTGVGGAIIVDGRVLRGKNNYAGEIGHMTISEQGPRCKCGNNGCLEAYVGAQALVRSASEKLVNTKSRYLSRWVSGEKRRLDPRLIAEAAERGDRVARAVFEEAGEHLGTAIASLINIFNPDVIAVAGGVSASLHLMKPRMDAVIRKRAFGEARRGVKIAAAGLGSIAAALGAALMARDGLRGGGC